MAIRVIDGEAQGAAQQEQVLHSPTRRRTGPFTQENIWLVGLAPIPLPPKTRPHGQPRREPRGSLCLMNRLLLSLGREGLSLFGQKRESIDSVSGGGIEGPKNGVPSARL